jgi:large subunit ribosomal protein L6
MSRVGKRTIQLPEGVTATNNNNKIIIKGPKGELTKEFTKDISINIKGNEIFVTRNSNEKKIKMLHGTTNSLIQGMVEGVTKGFEKNLEIIGVGYNVKIEGNKIILSLGLSHKVEVEIPSHLNIESKSQTELKISGIDKQKVGEFAAKIKAYRKPEPYGGKGIRYKGEHIIRKAGKAAK